jgi:hypothetical protein
MRRSSSGPLVLLLALATLSCEGDGPTAPPDSPECATSQATFTVVAPPVTFDEVGTLTAASCKLGRGSYADRWELVVPAAVDIEIDMTSEDVDSFIILRNADDEKIGSDDDGGIGGFNSGNSRLAGRIQAGTYYIMTTTFNDDAVGDYSLSVNVIPIPIP